MKSHRRGATILETLIGIALIAITVTAILQSLNVAITGTLHATRRSSASDMARSEIEYIKSQDYNASSGDISTIYGYLDISRPNYNFSGTVSIATVGGSPVDISKLQKITVNVNYLVGKSVSLTAYKGQMDTMQSNLSSRCLMVTDIANAPILPPGGFKENGTYWGYYYTIDSQCSGNISASWFFSTQTGFPPADIGKGNDYVAIYKDIPSWTLDDGHGGKLREGMITTGGNISSKDLICSNYLSDPHNELPFTVSCHTDIKSPGTYTVLFWNGVNNMAVFTQSASVSYFW